LGPEFSRYELTKLFYDGVTTALKVLVHEDHGEATLEAYLYAHLKYVTFHFKDCTQEYEIPSRMNYLGKEGLYYPYFDTILSFDFNSKPHLFSFVRANS
jgi:hypothetical protein